MTVKSPADAALPPDPGGEKPLVGMTRAELEAMAAGMGEPAFRGGQLFRWIYNRGAADFADMSDISKGFRARLAECARLGRPQIVADKTAEDGVRKWVMRYDGGDLVETVFIPNGPRGTLCVSSQVGCTLTCKFCHTGTQKWVRNLTAGEILLQLLHARDALEDWSRYEGDRRITNIVMMGMGEPLYNADNVIRAMQLMTDGDGLGVSRRRVMLSTAGVVPEIPRVGRETGVRLAVSLHAVTDELRDILVPINRKYPLAELLNAVREWPGLGGAGGRVTWEYVMLQGVNDSPADARGLAKLIRGIPSKINLIPFNPWPGSQYQPSSPQDIQRFADILWNAGYSCPVRAPRGRDILAACGQLKTETLRRVRRRSDDEAPAAATTGLGKTADLPT